MRRKRKLFLGILTALVVPFMAAVGIAAAQSFHTGGDVTVAQNQVVNSSLYAAGRNVDISGTVNGDIFCAAQDVSISGTVNGDIICAGQNVHVSGKVNGDVRLAGQSVSLSAAVSGSGSIAASSFTLEQPGRIGRDLSMTGTDVTLNSAVGRDVALAANSAVLTNDIGRSVKATVEHMVITSSARINGNLTYTSNRTADVQSGAVISGSTQRYTPTRQVRHNGIAFRLIFGAYSLVTLLILALVAALLLPRVLIVVSDTAMLKPWRTLLVGFLGTIIFPILFSALLFTVIGVPIALLLLLLWMVVIALGCLAFAFYIGRLIFRRGGNVILAMLVGALIVLIALMIPFLGVLVLIVDVWLGVGMVLTWLHGAYRRPSYLLPAANQ